MISEKPIQQASVTLVRRIKAPPAKVYAAWTSPERIARWWGPDAGPVLSSAAEARPGGHFRVVFQTLDGETHECSGVYRELVAERLLVFTWRWATLPEHESLVTVELRSIPEGTEMTFTHARLPDQAACDSHRHGWNGAFDKLDAQLARGAWDTTETHR